MKRESPALNASRPLSRAAIWPALLCSALALSAASVVARPAALATNLPVPKVLVTDGSQTEAEIVQAARLYAAFWNSGDPAFARAALSEHFVDRTLPSGRSQGLGGVLQASEGFRRAVPDLSAEIEHLLVADDYVTVRLRFRGHFSGQFGEQQGQGQAINFQAVDLYRVKQGRITDNWHLEDYQSLFSQMNLKP
ncbi:ester cyclase [Shewanella algae]|uniref:ester cyclase n=1 Tax=Shewanella algae TaxID=38313 RepID=UPI0009E2095B|nr:ester cyclase [Shewanella algae]QNI00540.1 ester cyclase [Shewanella algae]